MDIGEVWAYRARAQDALARVELLRIGTKRPPRVLVRFLDDQFEGKEEWVSPARLKVRWEQAGQWMFAERRWLAVRDASVSAVDSVDHRAAGMVLDSVAPQDFVDVIGCYRHAVLTVRDRGLFEAQLGFDAADLAVEPGYVLDDGTVVAPWPALLKVVKRVAEQKADALLETMAREDAKAEREAIHGSWYRSRRGDDDGHISAEICAEVDAKYKPARDLVRQWCGAEARGRWDELVALRQEVGRLGHLVDAAINALRKAGAAGQAAELERQLGVPVELLRRTRHDQ
jgi:hypothetical protein